MKLTLKPSSRWDMVFLTLGIIALGVGCVAILIGNWNPVPFAALSFVSSLIPLIKTKS